MRRMKEYVVDIETTGFSPVFDKLLAIGLGELNSKKSKYFCEWKGGEEGVILKFLERLGEMTGNSPIYGYNILGFDIPFIFGRAYLLGLVEHTHYDTKKGPTSLSAKLFIDLSQIYVRNSFWYKSFDSVLDYYELKRKNPSRGSDMPMFYKNKEYDKIKAHLKDDICMTKRLVKAQKERGYLPKHIDGRWIFPKWLNGELVWRL